MPIVVSNEGWVKLPPKPVKRSSKPADPVGILRGPLAYITGRPDLKEPVKKQSINQLIHDNRLLIEAAAPPLSTPFIADKPRKPRNRIPSAPATYKSKTKAPTEIFEEADEEIIRRDLRPDDSASHRSASPVGTRHARAAPSVRSRRHDDDDERRHSSRSKGHKTSQSVYDLDEEPAGTHRSRRHVTSSHSVYSEDEPRYHRSNRSERSYRDHGHSYSQSYAHLPSMPQIQPIVIYSTPPTNGCGGHHSCQSHTYQQHRCHVPQRMIETPVPAPVMVAAPARETAALPPAPARSEVSSRSSSSGTSRAMSYKWYTATQPLRM